MLRIEDCGAMEVAGTEKDILANLSTLVCQLVMDGSINPKLIRMACEMGADTGEKAIGNVEFRQWLESFSRRVLGSGCGS